MLVVGRFGQQLLLIIRHISPFKCIIFFDASYLYTSKRKTSLTFVGMCVGREEEGGKRRKTSRMQERVGNR